MRYLFSLPILCVVASVGVAQDKADWDKVAEKAINYLKKNQADDGSWGPKNGNRNRGVTGIVVTGLLQSGKNSPSDEPAGKGLKFIESLVNEKDGHIAGPEAAPGLQNYVTSINVMALSAAKKEGYKKIIGTGVDFLKKLQWDEGESKKKEDDFFGGAGYDSKSRPDLSNTQFFIDALKDAGVASNDPALQKALVFVSRCQNLKTEFNDQPWAGKINDGSFIYSAAGGGSTKTIDEPKDMMMPGYGSMTYAGIKSMIYCGVGKDDKRMVAAVEWLKANYSLSGNPGMPDERKEFGLYYYYHTMAKTLSLMGVDEFETKDGKKHNWRAEMLAELAKRQKEDGSWTNAKDRWLEGDPALVTGYVLMTMSYLKGK